MSLDLIDKYYKFIDKYGFLFLFLVDEDYSVVEEYGVWILKKNFGKEYMGIECFIFIINKEGMFVKEYCKVWVKGYVEEVLLFIKEKMV